MFGLKVIKKEEYDLLLSKEKELANKVDALSNTVKSLEKENAKLKEEAKKYTAESVVLLTDVAETPLKVEKTTPKKKVVKKTTGKSGKEKSHRTVVRKSEAK